jgi:hypothetical protein
MKTFKQFMAEMVDNIGIHEPNVVHNEKNQNTKYHETKSWPIAHNVTDHIKLHKLDADYGTRYVTNDHNKQKTIHVSNFNKNAPTSKIPFAHEEQLDVEKDKHSDLPRGYVTDMVYNHFKHSALPLRSSSTQSEDGHKMWRKLTKKALDDNHHVYYIDGKGITKSDSSNIDDHLDKYFNKDEDYDMDDPDKYSNRHMILSKTELK